MMNKSAKSVIESGNMVEVVDLAVEANRTIAQLTKELDALKAHLRDQGITALAAGTNNNVTFDGTIGVAQVVAVKPAPKAKKGVDLLATEGNLPADVWGQLFKKVTKVEISDDFESIVATLTPAQKAVVNGLVEVVASTPRVNIK